MARGEAVTVAELRDALAAHRVPDDARVMLLVGTGDGYLEIECSGVAGLAVRNGQPVVTLTTS